MALEDLTPTFQSLISRMVQHIGEIPLACWLLQLDGRHFLEESPVSDIPLIRSLPRFPLTDNQSSELPHTIFGPVAVVDSESPPSEQLVLSMVYPEDQYIPLGHSRLVPGEFQLHSFIHGEDFQVHRAHLPHDHPSIPESLRGRECWVRRIGDESRVYGLLAAPVDCGEDLPAKMQKAWDREKRIWRELQFESALVRRTETLLAIKSVGDTITSQIDLQEIMHSVVEQATILMKAKISSLMLVDEEKNELVLEWVYGSTPEYVDKPNLNIDSSLLGKVVKTRQPLMVRDVQNCEAYLHRDLARSEGLVSLLSVPLLWKEECIGVLNVYSAQRYKYTRDGIYLLYMLASQSAIAIQNARALQKTKSLESQIHELDKRSLVGEFSAGVAHEIRNPLAVVKMLVDNWETEDPIQKEDLRVITTQLKEMNRCVTQLLETSKSQPIHTTPFRLEEEVSTILTLIRVRVQDQEIGLRIELNPEIPNVLSDPSRLRQMLMNILLNALNVMPKGGQLTIRAETVWMDDTYHLEGLMIVESPHQLPQEAFQDRFVLLRIEDTGGGVSLDRNLKDLFEPFHTTSAHGFGIGLSVVKRIAEEGKIGMKVHNRPGEGLSFLLLLPGMPKDCPVETAWEG
ncbi:MAG: GAF domain-containing protein [Candidatus Omnitrophica bacterium]|nr:GAF domain-containing protein [Candidatus Omnitrophota bacterium]